MTIHPSFHPGDLIKCIDGSMPEGPYEVIEMGDKFVRVKFNNATGAAGFYTHRFELFKSYAETQIIMDSQEYEDILTGEEIYAQLKDGP